MPLIDARTKSPRTKIAALNELRSRPSATTTAGALREALADRSPHVLAKAAELCGELQQSALVDDLLAAYPRTFVNPLKKDPGCIAKTAIAEALARLDYQDVEPYRRGIRYRQYEPVWGGEEDTAAQLRAVCAAGMVASATASEAINCFADLLADPYRAARIGAARAIAGLGHWEGVPLLRLKLHVGDQEPEVMGECCTALLELAPEDSAELVIGLLSSPDNELRIQAALALGQSRHPKALEPLCTCWQTAAEPAMRGILLTCIGLLRTKPSREFLVALVSGEDDVAAADAIRALAPFRMLDELRQQVEEAVAAADNDRLHAVLADEFGPRRE